MFFVQQVGDYVLVKTLVPREEEDDEIIDGVQCYVPGIVQVVPLRKATATKCYTILRFNGKKVGKGQLYSNETLSQAKTCSRWVHAKARVAEFRASHLFRHSWNQQ